MFSAVLYGVAVILFLVGVAVPDRRLTMIGFATFAGGHLAEGL